MLITSQGKDLNQTKGIFLNIKRINNFNLNTIYMIVKIVKGINLIMKRNNLNNIFKNLSMKNKRLVEQERYEKERNKKSYNQPKQPQVFKQPLDIVKQFDNQKMEDKEQENIQYQQKQQTKLDDSSLCQICFEFPKQYVASPCGHFIYCHNCKELALKQCLICREPVQLLIKVFQ
ncbi:unnamed protein product (macronuclear) [Paramecium tetraurelia]|uniref:RING-type domain-containing protein n=1 Tax=Paramecium tetraurelia TaxID=5888 RepID=A0EEM4_PARTE|nr:uncharacterized protein GSPATT00026087001 [Paramecium tetraurelia]CAK93765.1 unnamed protein product [Paramecium tetraurelia]|eukprot:XP_001461138.1 hypothetical protein (macronuclear) [Paramecium tetraurelia strain d4-2]